MQTRMILTVHDELVFEAPDAELDRAKALCAKEMRRLRLARAFESGSGRGAELEERQNNSRSAVGYRGKQRRHHQPMVRVSHGMGGITEDSPSTLYGGTSACSFGIESRARRSK